MLLLSMAGKAQPTEKVMKVGQSGTVGGKASALVSIL